MENLLRRDVRLSAAKALSSADPFALLRIGIGVALLVQALQVAPGFLELYGREGLVQGKIAASLTDPSLPTLFWLAGHASDAGTLGIGVAYLGALVAMIVGYHARIAVAVVALVHWLLLNTGSSHNYGADQLATVALFYLVWAPTGRASSPAARCLLGVMRIHLCLVYFASGIEKSFGLQWRDGEAIWRSLMMPVYRQLDLSWIAHWPWIAVAFGWATLVVEIGYPVFVSWRKTRLLWLSLTVGMHLGIAVFLGLHVFALLMIALNVGLFLQVQPAKSTSQFSVLAVET